MSGKFPRRGWDEGSTAVEAAITFSFLVTLIFGIFEFGMTLWQWNTMQLAVLEAGRYAMVHNSVTPAIAEAQMKVVLPNASISCPLPSSPAAGTSNVCATSSTAGTPSTMSLSANYGYNVMGFVGPFQVTAQATVPLD